MIVGMNHFTVIAEDAQKTLDFYVGLLGLTVGHRPDLGFPGAWLYAGGAAGACCMSTSTGRCRRSAPASSTTWHSRPPG